MRLPLPNPMEILNPKFQPALEALVRRAPIELRAVQQLSQADILYLEAFLGLARELGLCDASVAQFVTQKDLKLTEGQKLDVQQLRVALSNRMDLNLDFAKAFAAGFRTSTYVPPEQRNAAAEAGPERQAVSQLPGAATVKPEKIEHQSDYDQAYQVAPAPERVRLEDDKLAITSSRVQEDEFHYFDLFDGKFFKALEQRGSPSAGIILKYAKKLAGNKDHRHQLERVLSEELLAVNPEAREVCQAYVLREKENIELVYQLQATLAIPDKELYELSIKYLCSTKLTFQISQQYYVTYYRLLQQFLTKADYKSVVNTNMDMIKKLSSSNDCQVLSILACVAKQRDLVPEELPVQLQNPTLFFVDKASISREGVKVICTQKLLKIEVYLLASTDWSPELLKQVKPHKTMLFNRECSKYIEDIAVPFEARSERVVVNFYFESRSYQWTHQFETPIAATQELTAEGIVVRAPGLQRVCIPGKTLEARGGAVLVAFEEFANESLSARLFLEDQVLDEVLSFPSVSLECTPAVTFENGPRLLMHVLPNCALQLQGSGSTVSLKKGVVSLQSSLRTSQETLPLYPAEREGAFEVELPRTAFNDRVTIENTVTLKCFGQTFTHSQSTEFDNSQLVKIATFVYRDQIVSHLFTEKGPLADKDVTVSCCGESFALKTDAGGLLALSGPSYRLSSATLQFQHLGTSYYKSVSAAREISRPLPAVVVSRGQGIWVPAQAPGTRFLLDNVPLPLEGDRLLVPAGMPTGGYSLVREAKKTVQVVASVTVIAQPSSDECARLLLVTQLSDTEFVVPAGAVI